MHINQFTVNKRLIGMYFKYPWGSLGFLGVKRHAVEIDIINALALILGTFYQQFMNNKATYVLSLVLQIGRPNFSELLKIN